MSYFPHAVDTGAIFIMFADDIRPVDAIFIRAISVCTIIDRTIINTVVAVVNGFTIIGTSAGSRGRRK
jgi:hypothetical protein